MTDLMFQDPVAYHAACWASVPPFDPGDCEVPDAERPKAKGASVSPAVRWEVWERDNFTCQHCGVRRFLTIDHVVPRSRGGGHEPSNLQTLCGPCNSSKGAR